jgi:hypothetical protein
MSCAIFSKEKDRFKSEFASTVPVDKFTVTDLFRAVLGDSPTGTF